MKETGALALIAVTACAAGERTGSGWRGTMDTLPSGAVVVSNPEAGVWDSPTAWRLVEDLRIGTAAEGPASFGTVRALEVDAAGRIYVLQSEVHEVRVFDSTGAYVRAIGRRGGGPGEFENANGLLFDPWGRLWIVDQQHVRNTVVDTAGRLVATRVRPVTGFVSWRWDGWFDDSGRMYEMALRPWQEPERVLLRFDTTFATADTFPLPRRDEETFVFRRGSSGYSLAWVPFSARLVWTLDRRGHLWFGVTDRYRLYERTMEGDTVRIIEKASTPAPVTAHERDSAIASLGGFAQGADPVDWSRIPGTKPAFARFVVDQDGYLLVFPHSPGASGPYVDVFDSQGRYLGLMRSDVRVPIDAPLVIRGGALYTAVEDEQGIPHVVRARIVRPSMP